MRLDDPGRAAAEHELRRGRVLEGHEQRLRRRASVLLALSTPALAGIEAASFPFLTRSQLTGTAAVLVVCLLGGLLGSLLVCVPRVAASTRIRRLAAERLDGLLTTTALQLLAGAVAGVAAAGVLVTLVQRESYSPQTVYVIAVALAVASSRRITRVNERIA
jgi:hypothetical protein